MYRRNVNLNDLINRFEVTSDDDFDTTENVKFVRPTAYVRQYSKMQDYDENFGSDENRALVKAYTKSDHFIDNTVFVRRSNVSMSGAKEFIKQLLHRVSSLLEMISKFPFPRMSVMSFGLTSLLSIFLAPRSFTERALYPAFKILFTIIYPSYRSFKAVRNKNLKEYLKWLVYWIVFAFFTCFELISDALFNWFPFYYEIKVIYLIWILGPSSRGGMKVYKSIIHPILISREQDIDNLIQLAQEHGYMQVFRLSSKSVNYANKIIMQQDAKTDSNFIVSHQLMKNISLSNLSDAGAIQSTNDNDDVLHNMRRYSIEKIPIYGNNQMNYSFENLESRRKPSFDYKYDDMMSSGYSSPISSSFHHRYPINHSQPYQKGAFIELGSEKPTSPSDNSQIFEQSSTSSRKSSIQLTEDEIILAYHKLQMEKATEKAVDVKEDVILRRNDDEHYHEFLKWMDMKRINEKTAGAAAAMSTVKENVAPQASNHNENEKVKINDINEKKSLVDEVDVNCVEYKCFKSDSVIVSSYVDEKILDTPKIEEHSAEIAHKELAVCNEKNGEDLSFDLENLNNEVIHENMSKNDKDSSGDLKTFQDECIHRNKIGNDENFSVNFKSIDDEYSTVESTENENKKLENEQKSDSDQDADFDEFKDAISEDDEVKSDDNFLNIPLIIREDNDEDLTKATEPQDISLTEGTSDTNNNKSSTVATTNDTKINNDAVIIPTTIIDDENVISTIQTINIQANKVNQMETENNTVNAKLTLTNDPLQIITNLSSSSASLASSLDSSENKAKRPARHSKGRAPQPPTAVTPSTTAPNVIDSNYYDTINPFKETEL